MSEKASIFLLYGDDGLAMEQFIDELLSRMGDAGLAELNTSRLDGRRCTLEDVRSTALALPFLSERRLVILTNPLPLAGKTGPLKDPEAEWAPKDAERRKNFINLLDQIPSSTALVLVIHDERYKQDWDIMRPGNWLLKWAAENPKKAWRKECQKPTTYGMPDWIQKQALSQGGEFTLEASRALTEHTGSETALAAQEITKLLTYAQYSRPVTAEDVELLVTPGGPVVIWDMIDALAEGRSAQAMRLLHDLLDRAEPERVFSLVVRQFRILIQVREVLDEGGGIASVKSELKGITVLNKTIEQARLFTTPELVDIYHRLLEIDRNVKLSQITHELGLELLGTSLERH